MEKFGFESEEEEFIYRQLLSPKEAVLEAVREENMRLVQNQVDKTNKILDNLAGHYSLATYDLEDPSRMKRIWGRVSGKLLKLLFMGPFAKKQIAYNKEVLTALTELRQIQEGLMEAMIELRKGQEEAE